MKLMYNFFLFHGLLLWKKIKEYKNGIKNMDTQFSNIFDKALEDKIYFYNDTVFIIEIYHCVMV